MYLMKLQRCQFKEAQDGSDFTFCNGACGPGIYAMKFGDKPMLRYYSKRGEKTFSFEVDDKYIKKIGGKGVTTYWAIREAIEREKLNGFKVFECKHVGIGIPKSKQYVITDVSIIENVEEK